MLPSNLDVAYTLTGDVVTGAKSGTATIVAGQTSVDVTVPTSDNTVYEAHHTVALTLDEPDDGAYGFTTGKQSASVEVRDDEFPDISDVYVDMESDDSTVAEDGTVTVTVRIALDSLVNEPHTSSPPVRVFTQDDTATAGADYRALDEQVSIAPEEFRPGVNSLFGGMTLVGTATLEIPILWDPDAESAERFHVRPV